MKLCWGERRRASGCFPWERGRSVKGLPLGLVTSVEINPSKRLDRWLSYKEHLFLLQKSQVQIPALMPQLTTTVTLVPGGLKPSLTSSGTSTHMAHIHIYMQAKTLMQIRTRIKITNR